MANRTVGEALVERLSLHGVDLLFGIISIHNLGIFDALHRYQDRVRHIGGRSELGCGFMADGYARSSGRPGVLVSSTGPGAANSMHAVGEAYHSSSPLLHLTTTVARGEREQGLGLIHEPKKQFRMLRSVTGHARRVEDPADLAPAVDEAFAALSTGRRRPAVLQFPNDLPGSPCGPGGSVSPLADPPGASEAELEQIVSALRRAERPLIWAGEELAYTGAHGTLIRLAETLGVPVVTGDGAKDAFPEDHPLSLGTCLGQRIWADNPVHEFTPGCDLVLALGSGFIHRSTVQLGIRLPEQVIQVVADPDYLGRNYPVRLGILADCGAVAGQILERVQGRDLSTSPGYRDEIRSLKRLIRTELQRQWPLETRAMEAIRSVLPRETITTWDTTVPASRASRAFQVYGPRTFLNPYGWVGIGFSFPAALGAKAANPATPVVCFSGDGGFQYCMAELATSVQYGLNVTVVLFNDDAWGVLKWMQKTSYGGRYLGTDLTNPDFVKLAEGYGIAGARVDSLAELLPVLEEAAGSGETTLIDVRIPRGFSEFA